MNQSGCIVVRADTCDNGVWLYTHNRGILIPIIIQNILKMYHELWNDAPYLTATLFSYLEEFDPGHMGISTLHLDMNDFIYIVNVELQSVEQRDRHWWSFEEFIRLEDL